mmetsp:Transcript_15672/g.38026  ORF Transcript_15672/g.38026 Transcript_15672/m.38026 type:complete len:296 (-) Transcript_15672:534-1421(-)
MHASCFSRAVSTSRRKFTTAAPLPTLLRLHSSSSSAMATCRRSSSSSAVSASTPQATTHDSISASRPSAALRRAPNSARCSSNFLVVSSTSSRSFLSSASSALRRFSSSSLKRFAAPSHSLASLACSSVQSAGAGVSSIHSGLGSVSSSAAPLLDSSTPPIICFRARSVGSSALLLRARVASASASALTRACSSGLTYTSAVISPWLTTSTDPSFSMSASCGSNSGAVSEERALSSSRISVMRELNSLILSMYVVLVPIISWYSELNPALISRVTICSSTICDILRRGGNSLKGS